MRPFVIGVLLLALGLTRLVAAEPVGDRPAWSERIQTVLDATRPLEFSRHGRLPLYLWPATNAADLDDAERDDAIGLLTDLTDGMWHWDLDALRRPSLAEQIPVAAGRRLALMYRHGERDDPYEQLTLARIRDIGDELRQRVIGHG